MHDPEIAPTTSDTEPAADRPPAPSAALRPRERILHDGPSALGTDELVALVLGTDAGARGAGRVAEDVLSDAGGLRRLAARTPTEVASVAGVGSARAARLLAALELGRRCAAEPLVRGLPVRASADVFRHFHPALRDLRIEQFRVVLLDGKHRMMREELISQGTLTSSPVHPREVFAAAIRHSAAALILVHNHPSGDPTPSADDIEITRRLAQVGELVGIRVLDHVIVGDGAFASLADRGLMP